MDTDQQVRLSFLEESEEYFEQMEQVLLGLPDAENPVQQLDVAMRAAHSLKGGAGMMGFTPMAEVAHRLEDFLKIIRARSVDVDTQLETLLLGGVDCLKAVRQQLSESGEVDEAWRSAQVDPLFEQLRDRLGDLSEADENKLLSADEEVDIATLVFNTGIEESLDAFEANVPSLEGEALRQAVMEQCDRLIDIGLMGEVDDFVALCQSVRSQTESLDLAQLPALRDQSLALWQRTQSLVMLGRLDNLPKQLDFVPDPASASSTAPPADELPDAESLDAVALAVEMALEQQCQPVDSEVLDAGALESGASASGASASEALDSSELSMLQAEMAEAAAMALGSLELTEDAAPGPEASSIVDEAQTIDPNDTFIQHETLAPSADAKLGGAADLVVETANQNGAKEFVSEAVDLSQLQAEFAQIELPAEPNAAPAQNTSASSFAELNLSKAGLSEAQQSPTAPITTNKARPPAKAKAPAKTAPAAQPKRAPRPQSSRSSTLRVSADELKQINNLFGSLILERNAVNLRQQQLNRFATLLQDRMHALEAFNLRLRQWYDQSSSANDGADEVQTAGSPVQVSQTGLASGVGQLSPTGEQDFDALEMDQYSDLHLLAGEQMETVVQLQEVAADICLGLQEMGTALQSLNGTTRQLQGRITRTQMRPFSDIAGRFPRLIRDLSVRYDKKVKLELEGESTLLERVALDILTDPLTHLLRNCFDHGIESGQERLAAGKVEEGTITLRATQLGNRARITLRDDGRGIPLEKIRDRMRQHDIPEEHIAGMGKQDLLSLIFDAGFSTAEKVTELSGRGVGMDVVRTNLNKVGGDIKVDTAQGKGTTFTIDIPLSLSVLRVMLLEQYEMTFAVPVTAVDELLRLDLDKLESTDEGDFFQWQDQRVPVMPLEQFVSFNGSAPVTPLDGMPVISQDMLMILRHNDGYYAVPIQRYWGEQEVATRPVASPLPLPTGCVGATVLGDGRVVPLMDLPRLISAGGSTAQSLLPKRSSASSVQAEWAEETVEGPTLTKASEAASQQTVLVVDDSVHLRRYLTLTLEKAGYFVEQARDGQEAVDRLLGGLKVEAVLCDVEMPRLDGYGVLDEIKGRPEFKDLPISMLTSRSSEKHRKLAMNLGASAYFAKPYNDQELLKTLGELIAAAA